jgi:hypothetical protein
MNAKAALGFIAGGVIGFLFLRLRDWPGSDPVASASNATLFRTSPGLDAFSNARILKKRMKGRSFRWTRVGPPPAAGSRFEIRLKDAALRSPLIPAIPAGVENIRADVHREEKPGTVYEYGLYQVLANGDERCLHDPELEIGQI